MIVVSALVMCLFVGCQTVGNAPEEHVRTSTPAEELLALFDLYWDLGEDAETGSEFMRRFREEPVFVVQALTIASPFQREQMLILIGSTIARAMHTDPVAHAEYTGALERAAGLDLDADSVQMLGFIHANIAQWSR